MKVLVADVEADGLLDTITRLWCVAVGDPKTGEVVLYADQPGHRPIQEGLERLQQADRVVFHNGLGYDFWAINRLYPKTLRFEQVWDSLIVSRLLDPTRKRHSLEDWGEDLGFPKGDYDDFSRWTEEMGRYCIQDVEVTIRVYRHLQRTLKQHFKEGTDWRESIALEHQVAFVIALQEQHGFRLDVAGAAQLAAELQHEYHELFWKLVEDIGSVYVPEKGEWGFNRRGWIKVPTKTPKRRTRRFQASEHGAREYKRKDGMERGWFWEYEAGATYCPLELQEFNPGSRKQIAEHLSRKYGWKPTKFTDGGAPAVDEDVLKDLPYPEAKTLDRLFRLTKQLGQVSEGKAAWLKLETNGYVHGKVNTIGARTGRMSHFAPNMAQVDKKDLRMRAVWLPDEGQLLVGCDAEGLELRVLAHYLAKWDGGAYAHAVVEGRKEDETDAHNKTRKAVGLKDRDNAKTFISMG